MGFIWAVLQKLFPPQADRREHQFKTAMYHYVGGTFCNCREEKVVLWGPLSVSA